MAITASQSLALRSRKTLSMRRYSMFENRETSEAPAGGCTAGRSGKTCGCDPDMHASEESDIGIVPERGPNKAA